MWLQCGWSKFFIRLLDTVVCNELSNFVFDLLKLFARPKMISIWKTMLFSTANKIRFVLRILLVVICFFLSDKALSESMSLKSSATNAFLCSMKKWRKAVRATFEDLRLFSGTILPVSFAASLQSASRRAFCAGLDPNGFVWHACNFVADYSTCSVCTCFVKRQKVCFFWKTHNEMVRYGSFCLMIGTFRLQRVSGIYVAGSAK